MKIIFYNNLYKRKKGIALILVFILVMAAVPITLVLYNLSLSQKDQSAHYNNLLNMEVVALSGINFAHHKLNGNVKPTGLEFYSKEFAGHDRFDISIRNTGKGFFKQNEYQILSKCTRNNVNSIIMAEAEQFDLDSTDTENFVITNDYWKTPEPFDIDRVSDVISIRNTRGKDLNNSIEIKKFEMYSNKGAFKNSMGSLKDSLPPEIKEVWDSVVDNLIEDKIEEGNHSLELDYNAQKISQTTNIAQLTNILSELFNLDDEDDEVVINAANKLKERIAREREKQKEKEKQRLIEEEKRKNNRSNDKDSDNNQSDSSSNIEVYLGKLNYKKEY